MIVSDSVLIDWNLSISSRLSNLLTYSFHNTFKNPLYFFGVSCYSTLSNFDFIWVLSLFFLMSLVKGSSIIFIFSKNKLLDSLIFSIIFKDSIWFIFALIFIISLLMLTLGFVCCSFSSSFKCKVRLFIWDFSCYLRQACHAMDFPVRTAFLCPTDFGLLCSYFHLF